VFFCDETVESMRLRFYTNFLNLGFAREVRRFFTKEK